MEAGRYRIAGKIPRRESGRNALSGGDDNDDDCSSLIIEADEAVLVRGGYHGLDRTLDPGRMALLVKRGDLRFAMVGDVSTVARRMGGDVADKPLADWIRLHGKRVDPVLWRVSPTRGSIELFDLHPEMGLVAPNL